MKLRIIDTPPESRALQTNKPEVSLSLSDKAATALACGASLIVLFASVAAVLIAFFQRPSNPEER